MKKTICFAIALSLLLCATAFAGDTTTPVWGQYVTVDYEIFNYPSGENTNTRLFIRNADRYYPIRVTVVNLVDPDGYDVHFNVGTEDSYSNFLDRVEGGSIILGPSASTSFSVTTEMLATSTYPVPTDHEGGRYFYFIYWNSPGGNVLPPEIWGIHRAVYSPRSERGANIRYSFERWEGRVLYEFLH